MRIDASPEAIHLVQEQGGTLYVATSGKPYPVQLAKGPLIRRERPSFCRPPEWHRQ